MVEREYLGQLSKWAGFVGIMFIIFGAISALFGLFAFVVGAIPGIISILLGVKLRNAKKYADEMLVGGQDDGKMNMLIMNLNTFFKIQGVLLIIYLALAGIALLSGVFAGIAMRGLF